MKKVLPPTVPESPAFALKKRIHREPRVEEVRTLLFVPLQDPILSLLSDPFFFFFLNPRLWTLSSLTRLNIHTTQ